MPIPALPRPRRAMILLLASGLAAMLIAWVWGAETPVPADRPTKAIGPIAEGRALSIVAFGTSLTAGPDWPARLQTALAACLPVAPVVQLLALPGAGSAWALTQTADPALVGADIVLVEFAINDADLRDGVSLAQAADQHRRLVAGLRRDNPDVAVVLMTMNPAHGLRGWMRLWLGAHYRQYRSLAAELDTGLVDLWPRWLALPRAARRLGADGLHPDAESVAQVILPVLLPYLAQAAGGRCV